MGEIGIMVSRLQQEGLDLEDMIDEELRAAGFLELCERWGSHLKRIIYSLVASVSSDCKAVTIHVTGILME